MEEMQYGNPMKLFTYEPISEEILVLTSPSTMERIEFSYS